MQTEVQVAQSAAETERKHLAGKETHPAAQKGAAGAIQAVADGRSKGPKGPAVFGEQS